MQLAHILYDSALISAGFDIDDQAGFNKRMLKMVTSGLDIGDDAVVDEATPRPHTLNPKPQTLKPHPTPQASNLEITPYTPSLKP